MTPEQIDQLHNEDEITWNDPDQGLCSKTGIISEIFWVNREDQIVCVVFKDGQELDCLAEELS